LFRSDGYPPAGLARIRAPDQILTFQKPGYIESGFSQPVPLHLPIGAPTVVYDQDGVSLTLTAGPPRADETVAGRTDYATSPATTPRLPPSAGSVAVDYLIKARNGEVHAGRLIAENRQLAAGSAPFVDYVAAPSLTNPNQRLQLDFFTPASTSPQLLSRPTPSLMSEGIPMSGFRPGDDPQGPFTCMQRPTAPPALSDFEIRTGVVAVRVKPDRSGYETVRGGPLPPVLAAYLSGAPLLPPPPTGWCDEPATSHPVIDNGAAQQIQLLILIGDRIKGVPAAAMADIQNDTHGRYIYRTDAWAAKTDMVLAKPFKAFGAPVVVYDKGGLRLTASAELSGISGIYVSNPNVAIIHIVASEEGMTIFDSSTKRPGIIQPATRLAVGMVSSWGGLAGPLIAVPGADRPERVLGVATAWAARQPTLEALAASPVFGERITPIGIEGGVLRLGPTHLPGVPAPPPPPPAPCPNPYGRMNPTELATIQSSGQVVFGVKADGSGFEREDRLPLDPVIAASKPPLAC
ncbi:MAG: hypothetical protein JWM33_3250, partial [Caulobacteraceae bacterium]|nr:hypothetical protein [Caulobacteraceae bacterium]